MYKKLPTSFKSLQLSDTFDTINDVNIRQRLSNRYEKIIQQIKSDLMAVVIAATERKMYESQKKYDLAVAQMWRDNRKLPPDQQLTQTMVDLIERRAKNISEQVKCLYDFKMKHHFFVNAPTMVKM